MKFKKSIWILCFRIKIHISNAVNILRDCLQMFFSFINIIHGVFSASTVLLPHCCSLIKDWRKSDLKWILPNCSLYLHWKRKMTYELRLQWNFERRGWKNNKPKSVLQLFELLCFDSRRQRVREIERERVRKGIERHNIRFIQVRVTEWNLLLISAMIINVYALVNNIHTTSASDFIVVNFFSVSVLHW